jgi:putative sterol carrier protein
MPYFTDAKQIYTVMQALFESMRDMQPDPIDALVSSHMVIRLALTNPDAHITIHGRQRPVRVDYGPPNGRADMEIGMMADTLHLILLDQYSVKQGFMNGEIKLRGPIWKALSFVDVFQKGRTFYPQVLQDQGLG